MKLWRTQWHFSHCSAGFPLARFSEHADGFFPPIWVKVNHVYTAVMKTSWQRLKAHVTFKSNGNLKLNFNLNIDGALTAFVLTNGTNCVITNIFLNLDDWRVALFPFCWKIDFSKALSPSGLVKNSYLFFNWQRGLINSVWGRKSFLGLCVCGQKEGATLLKLN